MVCLILGTVVMLSVCRRGHMSVFHYSCPMVKEASARVIHVCMDAECRRTFGVTLYATLMKTENKPLGTL